jgi:hypothetical protein
LRGDVVEQIFAGANPTGKYLFIDALPTNEKDMDRLAGDGTNTVWLAMGDLGPVILTYTLIGFTSGGASSPQTVNIAIPVGATVVVSTAGTGGGGSGLSVADSGSNSYAESISYSASYPALGTWTSANVANAATSVTVTASSDITTIGVLVISSGGAIGATGSNNNGNSAGLTTTANNSWVVGCLFNYTSGAGTWTNTGNGTIVQQVSLYSGGASGIALVAMQVPTSGTGCHVLWQLQHRLRAVPYLTAAICAWWVMTDRARQTGRQKEFVSRSPGATVSEDRAG